MVGQTDRGIKYTGDLTSAKEEKHTAPQGTIKAAER